MITRDVSQIRVVVGVKVGPTTATATGDGNEGQASYIIHAYTKLAASCGSLNGDSTGNAIAGLIIDRLGLGRNYNAVAVAATAGFDLGTSTASDSKFGAVYAWLYHSCTTCAFDFDRYSTDSEKPRAPAFLLNTTSTLASGYMATSTAVGTFGTFSATSTGVARADYNAPYSLAGANRYLRAHMFVEAYASSSGGTMVPDALTMLVFGEPDESPRTTTSTSPVYKT